MKNAIAGLLTVLGVFLGILAVMLARQSNAYDAACAMGAILSFLAALLLVQEEPRPWVQRKGR